MSDNLFSNAFQIQSNAPLADRLRPKTLDDFFGQESILGNNSLLRNAILNDKVGNIIFSGPPGVGKTTLIEIISSNTRSALIKLNAVLSSIKELRTEIANAKERLLSSNRKTILFIDEVHRFTSIQQDALLPSIENGTITFIGATTENPFFAVNKALISRARVFSLIPLNTNDLRKIIEKVVNYYACLEDPKAIEITEEAISHLIKYSGGDARNLINALESGISITKENKDKLVFIDLSIAEDSIQKKNIVYDKNGQNHFDVISAFIKSIRGSDPDATLYWLANMVEAGEDPNFIFRRLLISASEDIGLADPNAIVVVQSCCDAFDRVGLPEGLFFLSQASLYLAISPKSNSTKSIFKAVEAIKTTNVSLVPNHLKNNASNYLNPHNYHENLLSQEYLPTELKGIKFWQHKNSGWEKNKYDDLVKKRKS
ncbi:putative ATPase, AAA family [Prochlorococcus marinus str. MIT 9515]|uniref:Putative ATPase, AAA family n=1 Tax=Prochlorococcus marinus (strain MIT 9515) TaxID=167542 RepID=A2BU35_PROM5|nr:AAA family ATPase [Prochlorococcus marinus]ABM71296.1 putative ATPase, AAA family [Prochlorococcus marinus str. MIT 9515]